MIEKYGFFWTTMELCDWKMEGDDDKVLRPVIKYLWKQDVEYGVRVTNLTQGGLSAMEELENLEERREENAKEDQRFPKDAERLGSDPVRHGSCRRCQGGTHIAQA